MELAKDTETEKKSPGEDRIVLLSDGVFAIAMTLLILDIRLPEGLPHNTAFLDALKMIFPKFISYVITFAVISTYWTAHRRIMGYLTRIDSRFIHINILLLFFITTLPIPTTFALQQGDYADPLHLATVIYTLTLALTGFTVAALWIYATSKRRLVDPHLERGEIDYFLFRSLITPVFFVLSLSILLFSADSTFVYYSWIALSVIFFLLHRFRLRLFPTQTKNWESA